MALPKSIQQALAARRKTRQKVATKWRYSAARDALYVPIKHRSRKGKLAASKYDRMACSAGATAAMMRGFAASPRMTCGPRGMGMTRSHRLLGYWKGILAGNTGSLRAYLKNPADGDLVYVYQKNPEKGKAVEWALIEPKTESVLLTGTASNPEAGYKAAHKKAAEVMKKGAEINPSVAKREGFFRAPYIMDEGPLDKPVVGAEYVRPTTVVRTGKKNPKGKRAPKKNAGRRPKKNPKKADRAALRKALKGT